VGVDHTTASAAWLPQGPPGNGRTKQGYLLRNTQDVIRSILQYWQNTGTQ